MMRETQQECMLVPWKAFVSFFAQPFQEFFMMEPVNQGNKNLKVLINSMQWKSIEQSGSLLYDTTTK
jgi:hypothetical protein